MKKIPKSKINKVLKDAERVKKIHDQMNKFYMELLIINDRNSWTRYTGQDFNEQLNEMGIMQEYIQAKDKIIYATRWND